MAIVENRFLRTLIFSLGLLSLLLGVVGAFLPLLPTTPFVLLAAWCFVRSSSKAHDWLYRQPVLGPALRNWQEKKSISRPTKILASSMIFLSSILIWQKVNICWVKISVLTLLLCVVIFIVTRREK